MIYTINILRDELFTISSRTKNRGEMIIKVNLPFRLAD